MTKLQDLDVHYVDTSTLEKHLVKSITLDDLVEKEIYAKSLASAQLTIGEIPVFTDLGEKDLKLAMALTSKPYLNSPWR